jgi:hypothetical protein
VAPERQAGHHGPRAVEHVNFWRDCDAVAYVMVAMDKDFVLVWLTCEPLDEVKRFFLRASVCKVAGVDEYITIGQLYAVVLVVCVRNAHEFHVCLSTFAALRHKLIFFA